MLNTFYICIFKYDGFLLLNLVFIYFLVTFNYLQYLAPFNIILLFINNFYYIYIIRCIIFFTTKFIFVSLKYLFSTTKSCNILHLISHSNQDLSYCYIHIFSYILFIFNAFNTLLFINKFLSIFILPDVEIFLLLLKPFYIYIFSNMIYFLLFHFKSRFKHLYLNCFPWILSFLI